MAPSFLTPWSNFYIMTGSAAASLTGLMFVVITLVTGVERSRRTHDGISTFSTPTVVHFATALLICALLSVPWRSLVPAAVLVGLVGLCGIVYLVRVTYRSWRLHTTYNPDLEDWIWYTILPFVAYGAFFAGAIVLLAIPVEALFALAGGAVLLVFIGIHNAWDIVTFIVIRGVGEQPDASGDDVTRSEPGNSTRGDSR